MTNLSVLQRNMLQTMSEEAGALYLRGCDRDEWKACQMAWEFDVIAERLRPMLASGYRIQKVAENIDLWGFIKERQFRRYFPQGRDH